MDYSAIQAAHQPKKSLGQHWLHDSQILSEIAESAALTGTETVLEIGPGLGTLTAELAKRAAQVLAVEFDDELASGLQSELARQHIQNVQIRHADILKFDFSELPTDYSIVANIPYYLTSHLLRIITDTPHKPRRAVLLMQKEVAERVCAAPGSMAILSVAVQLHYTAELGLLVPARYFTPPPKVDSQVLVLTRHANYADVPVKQFMRLVRIGFSSKRKLLTNTLSAGYHISKQNAQELLERARIPVGCRAEQLSIEDWRRLLAVIQADKLIEL